MKDLIQKGKLITAILFIAGLSINSNAQCLKVHEGQHVASVTTTYENLLPVTNDDDYSAYTIEESDGAFEYKTTNYCINDTLYLVRNKDVIYSVLKGDTIGYGLQGIQKIPVNMKVGDFLPSFIDFGMTKPKTSTYTAAEKVNTGRTRTTTKIRSGYFQDSKTGEHMVGTYKETQKHDIFETIYHEVELAESLNFLTINYHLAFVADEEEIKIGDKTMNAFVIEVT